MEIDVTEINDVLVIKPRFRRLDAAIAPAFRDHVAARVTGRQRVVFALGNVDFMDSSGLGSIVSVLKQLPAGGVVRLAEVSAGLQKVLRLTRLEAVLQSFSNVEQAVA